ncbi:hypothetical protein B5M09_005146 [Aphanomyces astaci]|uniref:Protein NO VEIN C-terminal domain-containing protein n=1 Tax=Aphanomyces astaci TaxID=112090 RepID=A0A3R7ZHQ3_APHAT|nr:hypothetical protein B5M09_005146 [Aphanomyces astaci]
MRVRSFDDLNVGPPHAFAPIRQVLDLEHGLWEFVGMYVSLRSISTVHDAELEFLVKRGVPSFAALGLGNSFAASPAVAYYFNLPRATTTVLPLTTKAVLSHLGEFRFLNQRYQDTGAFLSFLTSKLAAPRGTVLGVHVQNLQRSMDLMRRIQVEERKQLNDIENDFRRDVAHSVFQLTKEKFSAENREKAVAAAVASSQLDLPRGEQKANVSVKLESDILTRVTVLDAHLDHLIGRYSHRLPKDTSSVISKQDPRPDADAILRDRWVTTHQSRPDLSTFQLLEAVHGATPTNSWAGGDHTSFVSALAALDSTQPLPLPPSAPSAASLPPDHVHALLYQCRLVQNAFESSPDEPSPALVSLVHHALSVEDPTKEIEALEALNGCPATAPYFSLYFTSPLTNLAGIDTAPSTLDMAALLSSVERVPCLVDVQAAVLWQDLHHGPFPQFFMSNFPHIPLLQLPTKRFVKLDASMATLSQLQDTTSAPQAHKVATSYVSLYVLSHGRVPWSDLPHAFECVLSTVDLHVRPWFVLQVLQYVPAVFWKVLAPPVLLALGKTVSHVHRALANATTTSVSDRVLLGQLGQVLEISPDLFATLDNTHKDDKVEEAIAKPPCPSVPLSLPAPCFPVHPPGKDVPPLKSHQLSANQPANHISTPHDKMDKCQDVVEHIRKHSFGVGLPGSSDTRAFLRVQQDRLERALQRLSAELYSTSTHFVLELLQNADDNAYAPHVAPCAEFVVRDDAISFFCNEIGFQASHVRALCDVGASTKSVGMIGQKGIGFKSVFAVSDCPEIHSNGYHVHFDARARAGTSRS